MNIFSDRFFLLSSKQFGWAVSGAPDKYLCSEMISSVNIEDGRLSLELEELVEYLFWYEEKAPFPMMDLFRL
ncbi:hypothetical protein [Pontiella agarivorans]|uniref:Uncharacterized protein n=1 Tax=Pontiella agarivorans TaxID=3038953 RepID=A0ABU5N223_9BACT|nr:hypothetical protein [Pontiella agarivorans]MDZ8120462.1 hypothetical protein [Pontiella agarivorans]